jgi:hypothetical protein
MKHINIKHKLPVVNLGHNRENNECQPQRDVGLPRDDGGTSRRREDADLTGQEAEAPAENVTMMPVVEPKKKRRRDRNLAAERRRQKPKTSTRENGGPQEKLAPACWKVPRRATVAWRKRNISKENLTQRKCSPRKEVTAARKITRSAGHKCKGRNKDDVTPRYPKKGTTCCIKVA